MCMYANRQVLLSMVEYGTYANRQVLLSMVGYGTYANRQVLFSMVEYGTYANRQVLFSMVEYRMCMYANRQVLLRYGGVRYVCQQTGFIQYGGVRYVCQQTGFIEYGGVPYVYVCQQTGFIEYGGVRYVCQQTGFIQYGGVPYVYVCQQTGFIEYGGVPYVYVCQQTGFIEYGGVRYVSQKTQSRRQLLIFHAWPVSVVWTGMRGDGIVPCTSRGLCSLCRRPTPTEAKRIPPVRREEGIHVFLKECDWNANTYPHKYGAALSRVSNSQAQPSTWRPWEDTSTLTVTSLHHH